MRIVRIEWEGGEGYDMVKWIVKEPDFGKVGEEVKEGGDWRVIFVDGGR